VWARSSLRIFTVRPQGKEYSPFGMCCSGLVPHQKSVFKSQAKRVALRAIVRIIRQLANIPLGNGLSIPALGKLGFIVGHQISTIAFGALQWLFFEIAVNYPLAVSA
jgi:hypothetical protein